MSRYVALLKGINVGRRKRIAMADLRALLTGLGYADVATYLASGNALFSTSGDRPAASLAADMEERIAEGLGMVVRVIVRTPAELAAVMARNPLGAEPENPSRFFVGFLSTTPDPSVLRSLERDLRASAPAGDAIWLTGAEAFLWCPGGFSLLDHSAAIEKRLGVVVTTRTWNTVTRLVQMAAG
ncbi:MAG: DUF1697 domain-containing protein [Acidimicrobiales bacterium]|jgi:uncharacterized protein (DUF1697 family)